MQSACLLPLLAAMAVMAVAGCSDEPADEPTASAVYQHDFVPALEAWNAARTRESERLEAFREDWNADVRNLLQIAEDDRLLRETAEKRKAAEQVVRLHAARLIRDFPWTYEANCVQRDYLTVLRDEIRLLLQRRSSLREQYARPLHVSEHWLVQAESSLLEEEIARRFTAMQRHFSASPMIRPLEEEVLRPRYEELMKALASLDTDPNLTTAALDERSARLLDALEDLKRRYPLSDYTRKAERHIVPVTAPRTLLDLRGWPAAVFFCSLALLLVGFGRSLAAYIAKRQKDDEAAAARVFRPAPWVRGESDGQSSDALPVAPLTAPRRPVPTVPRDATPPQVPAQSETQKADTAVDERPVRHPSTGNGPPLEGTAPTIDPRPPTDP